MQFSNVTAEAAETAATSDFCSCAYLRQIVPRGTILVKACLSLFKLFHVEQFATNLGSISDCWSSLPSHTEFMCMLSPRTQNQLTTTSSFCAARRHNFPLL